MPELTRDLICTYLQATGWDVEAVGTVKTQWIRRGQSAFVRHETSESDLDDLVFKISMAEDRHPADVRDDILNINSPMQVAVRTWATVSVFEHAAAIVRRQIAEANDDGWHGVWDWQGAEAMGEQAEALATALEKTAVLIKAAAAADPAYPRHPLWSAAARAAEAIILAESVPPDDMEALKRRLNAMRAEAAEAKESRP